MTRYIEFEKGTKNAGSNAFVSDTHEGFTDCGILLEENDIVVDIDWHSDTKSSKQATKQIAKKLIDFFDIKTQIVWTDNGVHLYFKKPEPEYKPRKKTGLCALGFKIEIFTKTQRNRGLTVKRNGVLRTIENEGEREVFPDIFDIKTSYDGLVDLDEGEGRNEALFAHRAKIKNLSDELKILEFINYHVFASPLPNDEFQTVARPNALKSNSKCSEAELAQAIKDERRCCKWRECIWFWDEKQKAFISDNDELIQLIYKLSEGEKTKYMDEVKKQIEYSCRRFKDDEIFKIRLKNGYLENGKFYPYPCKDFTPYGINISYEEDTPVVEEIEEYISQLVSSKEHEYTDQDYEDYRNFILEVMAFGLVVDPEKTRDLCKFFIFRGEGANGKGTLLQIIRKIYGAENCSSLSVDELADMRFLVKMATCLVNLGDDIEDKPIGKEQFKIMKNITSGDIVEVRHLYKESNSTRIQTKMIFTSNHDIRTFDKGDALERRMCWMPMFNRVTKPDPKFISRMTNPEALQYWMKLIVEAYERLYENGWTKSKICDEYNAEYHKHNNLSLMFIEEVGVDELLDKTIKEIEVIFNEWNTEDDRKFDKKNFKFAIWKTHEAGFQLRRYNSKPGRYLTLQSECDKNLKPTFK